MGPTKQFQDEGEVIIGRYQYTSSFDDPWLTAREQGAPIDKDGVVMEGYTVRQTTANGSMVTKIQWWKNKLDDGTVSFG